MSLLGRRGAPTCRDVLGVEAKEKQKLEEHGYSAAVCVVMSFFSSGNVGQGHVWLNAGLRCVHRLPEISGQLA